MKKSGTLHVVGSGITYLSDLTQAARACITAAEQVFYATVDALASAHIHELNANAQCLPAYLHDQPRTATYDLWTQIVMAAVREGQRVCLVAYGHPGVFARVPHRVIRMAREEGFQARMFPGISALAHLFADLRVDPAEVGLQCFEATDFLIYARKFDPQQALILWQVSVIGVKGFQSEVNRQGLAVLQQTLLPCYGGEHRVTVYKASQLAFTPSHQQAVALGCLHEADIPQLATLYIPPLDGAERLPIAEMMVKLGLTESSHGRTIIDQ